MRRKLEVLGFWPDRTPCVAVLRVGRAALPSTAFGTMGRIARALAFARDWYAAGAERVQVQNVGPDKREVLVDWCSSRWQRRRDEAGRIAKKHAW